MRCKKNPVWKRRDNPFLTRNSEQLINSMSSLVAQMKGILIHEKLDMVVHDCTIHFPGIT